MTQKYNFFFIKKNQQMPFECMNVILLHSIIQHVFATRGHLQGGKHKEYNYDHNVSEKKQK